MIIFIQQYTTYKMPRNPIDYSKTIMYKIVCKDLSITDIYVGHTTDFRARKNNHKSTCYNINKKSYNFNVYQFIRKNNGWDNWDMVKIEDYPCLTILDAGKRERELIETLNATLNNNIPTRTDAEYSKEYRQKNPKYIKIYRENNQDKINEKVKIYYENNIDKIKNYQKEWFENNKDKIKKYYENNQEKLKEKFNCDCGGCYTFQGKAKHQKTKKHLLFLDKQ